MSGDSQADITWYDVGACTDSETCTPVSLESNVKVMRVRDVIANLNKFSNKLSLSLSKFKENSMKRYDNQCECVKGQLDQKKS